MMSPSAWLLWLLFIFIYFTIHLLSIHPLPVHFISCSEFCLCLHCTNSKRTLFSPALTRTLPRQLQSPESGWAACVNRAAQCLMRARWRFYKLHGVCSCFTSFCLYVISFTWWSNKVFMLFLFLGTASLLHTFFQINWWFWQSLDLQHSLSTYVISVNWIGSHHITGGQTEVSWWIMVCIFINMGTPTRLNMACDVCCMCEQARAKLLIAFFEEGGYNRNKTHRHV